jgi:cell division protein DivIC
MGRSLRERRRRSQNRFAMMSISTVVVMLLVVITFKSIELQAKNDYYASREAVLNKQIAEEQERTEEIEEYKKYITTKKYVEEVAKDKLGLVYEDEVIFKPEE